mmetsp:Transcript_20652/g.57615  ORF Transcript_20652/g.57615 Transcript_20652/m.57615 type:complete len:160 (+) Transcript_20652:38-517(+)
MLSTLSLPRELIKFSACTGIGPAQTAAMALAARMLRPLSAPASSFLRRPALGLNGSSGGLLPQHVRRISTGIRILDDAGKAREDLYWAQEDERLLAKMVANHPELDPKYQGVESGEESTTEHKVKMIFIRHGIPPVNRALVSDIASLIDQAVKLRLQEE